MLLVIYNLPFSMKYADVKNLIQKHCGLTNVILDDLKREGTYSKVTVGVADEADAVLLVRKLNGLLLYGNKLQVEEMRRKNDKDKTNRNTSMWSQPNSPNNLPSLMGQSTLNLAQNTSMLGQNKALNQNFIWDLNNPMGQTNAMIGQNVGMLGQNYSNSRNIGQNSTMLHQSYAMMGQDSSIRDRNYSMNDQHSSMKGNNYSMKDQNSSIRDRNSSMMRQEFSTDREKSPLMGRYYSTLSNDSSGLNPQIMGHHNTMGEQGQIPKMVPPPLMDYTVSQPFSGSFYMSPQNYDYGMYNKGQPSTSKSSDRQGNASSNKYGFSDKGSRRDSPNKPIPVWISDHSNKYGRDYSGNEGDRYKSGKSSSMGPVKRELDEIYQSVGTRDTVKRVTPWESEPPYARSDEYRSFDRSRDHERDRYSNRLDDSSTRYRRQPVEGSHSRSNYRSDSPSSKVLSPSVWMSRDERPPPPKRFKAEPREQCVQPAPSNANHYKQPKKGKITMQKIMERDVTWRNQAASDIVKDMMTKININPVVPKTMAFQMMKAAVRSRLMIIVNNRLEVKIPEQLALYRRRFKEDEDQCLYNRIVRHILHEQNKTSSKDEDKDKQEDAQPTVVKETIVVPQKPAPVEPILDRLPKYPQGDKKAFKLHKQQFAKEFQPDSMPNLDNVMKKALYDEIDAIKEIIVAQAVNPKNESDEYFCKGITNPALMDELKNMLELNVTKRLLNLGTVPMIRILGGPRLPKKALLDEYLQTRGVLSLKKSVKASMYIATCDSYDSFDKLCAMNNLVIDNVKVVFKPMYLTGPVEKGKKFQKQHKSYADKDFGTLDYEPAVAESVISTVIQEHDGSDDTNEIETANVDPIENQTTEENEAPIDKNQIINEEVITETDVGEVSNEVKETEQVEPEIGLESNPVTLEAETTQMSKPESGDNEVEAESSENKNAEECDDVFLVENDYSQYTVDDSMEVNEDDLEDY